jgi:hypothetical protein
MKKLLLKMPFDLQAATAADLPALVSVFQAAFDDNPHFKCMSPGCDPAVVRSRNLKLFRKDWDKPGRRHFKVLDRENGYVALLCILSGAISIKLQLILERSKLIHMEA